MALSPDGRWIAVGSDLANATYLYDLKNLEARSPMEAFRLATPPSTSLSFSAHQRWLAVATSVDDLDAIQLYAVLSPDVHEQWPLMHTREVQGWIRSVLFSPNSTWLVVASESYRRNYQRLEVLQMTQWGDPSLLQTWEGTSRCSGTSRSSVAFSTDGEWLAVCSCDRSVRVFNLTVTDRHRPMPARLTLPMMSLYCFMAVAVAWLGAGTLFAGCSRRMRSKRLERKVQTLLVAHNEVLPSAYDAAMTQAAPCLSASSSLAFAGNNFDSGMEGP
jgi:WD40 repeat protein